MLSLAQLNLYLVAATLLVMAPGPDTLFVIARSVESGRKGGVLAALGICLGEFAHIGAATVGLSALVLSSAMAFTVVKTVGALYLLYLGIKTLTTKPKVSEKA
ncbi:MAG TPA: LysE family translocator, partial [Fimbriimonas sp.]|nr:LysE family translocator [Fimbriimonas sp.]